jgi:hypothetical protein
MTRRDSMDHPDSVCPQRMKGFCRALIFHKVKLGILFGLNVKKMEFRDIPVEIFGKAVRGKG